MGANPADRWRRGGFTALLAGLVAWVLLSTPGFTILRAQGGADNPRITVEGPETVASFVEYTRGIAPRMLEDIEKRLGVSAAGVIRLEWLEDGESFRMRLAEIRPSGGGIGFEPWVAGVALHPEGQILLRASSIQVGDRAAIDNLLRHELAHVVLGAIRHPESLPQPVWLHEGLAQWAAGQLVFSNSNRLRFARSTGGLHDFVGLEAAFPTDAGEAAVAYQQSESMIRFLVRRYGSDTLRKVLVGMSTGKDFFRSFAAETGEGFYSIEDDWHEFVMRDEILPWLITRSGIGFAGLSVIAVVAFVIKRRRRKDLLRNWEVEEEAVQTLSIQVIGPDGEPLRDRE